MQDITNLDFWPVTYRFISNTDVDKEGIVGSANRGVSFLAVGTNLTSNLSSAKTTPNVWIAADSLAKSFYSTILVDLGQVTASSNILTNATSLQYFSQNIKFMQTQIVNAIPGPANDSYDALEAQTGPLTTTPAVIATKYLCQVPKRKSPGTLFVSILIADLVLLQALWKILNFCTTAWLTKKDPRGVCLVSTIYFLNLLT